MMMESFLNGKIRLHIGDCMDVLPTLDENSLDSCVTDPPYHLTSIVKRFGKNGSAPAQFGTDGAYARASAGFMGKQWDGGDIAFRPETWAEVYRVLKPGAHLLAFGGTRTYHRMACAIEDAGFEIRDCIQWLYGSGFPKSHDVSKGIDRAAGAERSTEYEPNNANQVYGKGMGGGEWNAASDPPATDAVRQWEGWGTALKPACEPIVLARKPLSEKTVAANVLKWGTGAINVGGCRVGSEVETWPTSRSYAAGQMQPGHVGETQKTGVMPNGRWPANVIHDGSEEVLAGFPDNSGANGGHGSFEQHAWMGTDTPQDINRDKGSAARFFYTAKADSDDRIGSKHPTVKPLDLMQYLVRLVTPNGGTVLDMFAGSGTTGEAAFREGMKAVLIEREAEYQTDVRRRMDLCMAGPDERSRETIKSRGLVESPGPLFDSQWDGMWSKPFHKPELL